MKLFTCYLLLLFATMVVTSPIRARRENVLTFLDDALDTATEKTIPATITAYRNVPTKPVKEQDSEDMSEAKSTETFDTNEFTDAFQDPDSHETMVPKVLEKDKTPSRRKTGGDKDNMELIDMSSRLVRDQDSRDQSRLHGAYQASREQTDHNSEEGLTVDVQDARASLGTNLQRRATPGRVNGSNGLLAPGQSREVQDWDSLEDNNGRPAPVGNRGDKDYDETRELISSETYPIGAPPAQ